PTRGRNSRGRRGLAATVLLPQAQTRARPLRLDWTSWWRSRTTIQQATSVLESAKTLSALRAEGRMGMKHLHGPAPRYAGSALGYAPIAPGPPRGRPQIKRCRLLSPPIASIGRAPYRGTSAQPFWSSGLSERQKRRLRCKRVSKRLLPMGRNDRLT